MMVAGEASGDAQAAKLAAAMHKRDPNLEIFGVGGPAMRRAGVDTQFDSTELSIMGFTEALGALARVRRCYRHLKETLRGPGRPDLLVLIDFPDFNIPLAGVASRTAVPVLYYVGPQVWAWRRGRIAKLARRIDRMIVVFPFEAELYRARGMDAHFVGNPLAEDVRPSGREGALAGLGTDDERPLVALLPGSRRKEVTRVLPVMLEAARALGYGRLRIIFRHLLPNIVGPVIIYATLTVPAVMLLEAVLSFLGLGVQAPMSSWGLLIKNGAEKIDVYPWLLAFPAIFFSLTLFSLNFIGDGLRDALDPKSSKD